jgi:hypothetical protein
MLLGRRRWMRAASARPISGVTRATTARLMASCISKMSDISPSNVSAQIRWPVSLSVRLAETLILSPARRIAPPMT